MLEVIKITKNIADKFVSLKHYSHRPSVFQCAFGLVEDGLIAGVVVFGMPPRQISKGAFKERDFPLYELTRLVVQTHTKNAASMLVGQALRNLETPSAVVSYADMEQGHVGIIYQATNWIYTGATVSHDSMYVVEGRRIHPRTLAARGITAPKEWAKANGIQTIKPFPKHRYFYLNGTQKQKKRMLSKLNYTAVSVYPKIDQHRYDDGEMLFILPDGRDLLDE